MCTTNNKHVEFVAGVDEHGRNVTHTADLKDVFYPDLGMSNNPVFVHFDARVLDKYRQNADKGYAVWDMCVSRKYQWSLPLDNRSEDTVCVLLAYLSKLPYEEQCHWRAFNIPSDGEPTPAYYAFYIEKSPFENPEKPKHRFREAYYQLRATCYEYLGWQLLLPPDADEEQYIGCLTVPAANETADFDALVSSLCTLCIDSLNVAELRKLLPLEQQQTLDGKDNLACLIDVLCARGVSRSRDYLCFLRELQRLRRGSAAQRKACNYQHIADNFGYDNRSPLAVFTCILSQAISLVRHFTSLVEGYEISLETRKQRRARWKKGYAATAAIVEEAWRLADASKTED